MRLFDWLVRSYRWCASCGKKAANTGSELCPSCQASLELGLKELLKDK
jgi:NADH pyrophosphatase NudC (nudix superfamily)